MNLRELDSDTSQTSSLQKTPHAPPRKLRHDWVRFSNQFKRAFLSKLRNRANLATTLLEAPALAILIAMVMRYSETGTYNFANAFHIPTYLFLGLVTALFLGMTNSAEEIIRDRNLLQRERDSRRIVYLEHREQPQNRDQHHSAHPHSQHHSGRGAHQIR